MVYFGMEDNQVLNIEKWKQIPNLPYEISSLGKIRNLQGKVLKTYIQNSGYEQIKINYQGLHIHKSIHRLVAEAFIPNPNNLPIVNHKDENPANNIVSNLEWCTVSYNNNYNKRNEKIGDEEGHDISVYDKDNKYIESFPSITKAANAYDISLTTLWRRVQDGQIINNHYFKEEL